jgi:uncharacterized protein (TIGR02246 family)
MTVAEKVTTEAEILAVFQEWHQAVHTGNPAVVPPLYAPHAILLPTLSNRVRRTTAEIQDYFVQFLQDGERVKTDVELLETDIKIYGDIAMNSGIYLFTFNDGTKIPARFTFVYERIDGRWLIITHHSSGMPE